MKKLFLFQLFFIASASGAFAESSDKYYGTIRLNSGAYRAHDMESSARPGLGQFVPGKDLNTEVFSGSVAMGYHLPSNWRIEGEYTFPTENEFTSGSTNFPASFNHHKTRSQRFMAHIYKDVPINEQLSIFGTAGAGFARVESSGWQGNESRQYFSGTETNLAYSLGLGITYKATEKVNIDVGYRYVYMGKAYSGANNFTNVRGEQDEQMRAKLTSSEVTVGVRYNF